MMLAEVDRQVRDPARVRLVAAQRAGAGSYFPGTTQVPIIDDHVPFLEAGVPAIDLIDWAYPYKNTVKDTLDKLSPAALDAVGGWDEEYFMYMEDLDLCRRLRDAGFDVAYEPGGSVTHVGGASTSQVPYRMLVQHHRSALRYARKRLTGPRAVLLPFAAVYLGARCALAMAEHAWHAPRAVPGGG